MQQHDIENLHKELEELKETNKELLVYKQQLDAILNNAPVEVYLKDRDGRYLRINKQFEKIFGVKNEDLVGQLPSDVHDSTLAASTRAHDLLVLESGTAASREEKAKLVSDGKMHTLLTIKFPVFNDNAEVDGLGAIVTDISELKQMEESLRRVQKMDAIGQLTGGIAHDFNNILCIVMGNLELINDHIKHDKIAYTRLQTAYKSANRGAELIRKLLSFSGKRSEIAKLVSLNAFLNEMEAIITQSLTVSIDTKMLLEKNLWLVSIDPSELEDTIINLSLNARDAMPDGGEMIIRTANITIDENDARENDTLKAGDYALLCVSDNGIGMTPDVQKKAIEPFFTTKPTDRGTGLGLSMVHNFVYRSSGQMKIQSEPGKGTMVRILLPRAHEEAQNDAPQNTIDGLKLGKETVLIVDDEKALVDIAVSHLQSLGYETLTAHNSAQALAVINDNPTINLLFSDVIMPGGIDGRELAIKVQAKYPAIKILVTSGFAEKYDHYAFSALTDAPLHQLNVLRKPYDKLSLSSAVRAALDTNDKA